MVPIIIPRDMCSGFKRGRFIYPVAGNDLLIVNDFQCYIKNQDENNPNMVLYKMASSCMTQNTLFLQNPFLNTPSLLQYLKMG